MWNILQFEVQNSNER